MNPSESSAAGARRPSRRRAGLGALALAALLGGCIPDEGPLMAPGEDCLGCHDGRGAKRWTAAGTWLPPGSEVRLTDRSGRVIALTSNGAGNFYTAEPLDFPLVATVGMRRMPDPVTDGSCNTCHWAKEQP
ncbi:MAG: hypothetical protein IPO09_20375 [Anaeromyxobacter sp.]|nr:hypothetical protein [Anaeromyxobacter sp.]